MRIVPAMIAACGLLAACSPGNDNQAVASLDPDLNANVAGAVLVGPEGRIPPPKGGDVVAEQPLAGNASATVDPSAVAVTDGWIGRWTGPEGLFLEIRPDGATGTGRYQLTVKDTLDAEAGYRGATAGRGIQYREGTATRTIQATDGAGTGLKWLAGKKQCLVIRPGAGFCRD